MFPSVLLCQPPTQNRTNIAFCLEATFCQTRNFQLLLLDQFQEKTVHSRVWRCLEWSYWGENGGWELGIMGGGMGNGCGTLAISRVDGIEQDGSPGGERYGAPIRC